MIYNHFISDDEKKKFGLLIDPENYEASELKQIVWEAEKSEVDFILLGGSLLSKPIDPVAKIIKDHSNIPVILFPGSPAQISEYADAIFLLSLISGRNPDLLIGNHVLAAKRLKYSSLEVIPTSYILINGGKTSAVEYISNTRPIPAEKTDITVSTAIAGELMGHKLTYLESGSGASHALQSQTIQEVKKNTQIPLIVGGGLKEPSDINRVCQAGADMVVVGNAIEHNFSLLKNMVQAAH